MCILSLCVCFRFEVSILASLVKKPAVGFVPCTLVGVALAEEWLPFVVALMEGIRMLALVAEAQQHLLLLLALFG